MLEFRSFRPTVSLRLAAYSSCVAVVAQTNSLSICAETRQRNIFVQFCSFVTASTSMRRSVEASKGDV